MGTPPADPRTRCWDTRPVAGNRPGRSHRTRGVIVVRHRGAKDGRAGAAGLRADDAAAEVTARAVDRLTDNRVEVIGVLEALTINLVGLVLLVH